MNIFIISQYLESEGKGDDRLFRLGREMTTRGHNVTALTSNGAVGMELGKKNIGLFNKNGLNVIAFNVPYAGSMNLWQQASANLKFARMAGKQGRSLPGPDLILVKAPPLTAALPAMKLSGHYRVPLVAEFRELWPDALVERGSLRSGPVIKVLKRLEQNIYAKANRIIAVDESTAQTIRERLVEQAKVRVVEDSGDEELLLNGYEQALKDLGLDQNTQRKVETG